MTTSTNKPSGSLLVAWQLHGKHVLVVGGGNVASGRLAHALTAKATVTIIAPRASLHPDIVSQLGHITHIDREFSGEQDLEGVDMVLCAIDDVSVSSSICTMARSKRIPVNVADIPPECDFYFGSMINQGPLQIMVSTNGKGPKIANLIKQKIEQAIPPNVEDAIERTGKLRAELRKRAPGVGGKVSEERMRWMTGICESWTLEELAQLDDSMIARLLKNGWDKGRTIPSHKELIQESTTTPLWCSITSSPLLSPLLSRGVITSFSAGLVIGLVIPYIRRH
ncbi:Bifunctional dehydrogenase and ferrochelatase [Tulasnella sp. 419]|nr:Bifunctional dehydrogenase and ferrochelatase [Tulasnella sp. 419]